MAALNFDATQVAPQEAFAPIPAAEYNMTVVASETKPTKDGQGWYLQLQLEVLDGAHKGRKVFDRLNLGNTNETAVKIAQQTLSAICHATGVLQLADSAQLHGKPMTVAIRVKPASGQYEAGNEVKGYGAYMGASAVSAPAFASAAPPVAAATPAFVPPTAPVAPAFVPPAPVAPPPAAPASAPVAPPWARQG